MNESWNDPRFRKPKKLHPVSVNIWAMISYENGVEEVF